MGISGIPFNVRRVNIDEKYGLNNCLNNDTANVLIEFYDARYQHTPYGQFISRYYAKTLKDHQGGLSLQGDVPEWQIDAENMKKVVAWAG